MDKKTLKKREIIEKSFGAMFSYGYHGTSVKDLADAAGIPKGSLYNYFENKEDYVKEALNYYYQETSKPQFDTLVDRSLKPLERIRQFYAMMIKNMGDHDVLFKGCFVGNVTQEMCGINDGIQEVIELIHQSIVDKIKMNLEEAIGIGELSVDKNPEVLAEFIHSSWHGTLLRVKSSRDKKTLDNFYNVLIEVLLK